MVDTNNKVINSNVVNTCRLRAYGDPANPTLPIISAPTIATQILYAPYFDGANNAQFSTSVLLANNEVHIMNALSVSGNVIIGERVPQPSIPTFNLIQKGSISMHGGTFANTFNLNGGMITGLSTLYSAGPRPSLPANGKIIGLDGGKIYGTSQIYT